jgi:hypothetical protein
MKQTTVQPPWVLLCSLVAAGGLSAIAQAFQAALPAGSTLIANIVAIIVAICGFVVTYYQAVNTPAQSVAADAPVFDSRSGEKVGVNVSTTSTAPIVAPQKEG